MNNKTTAIFDTKCVFHFFSKKSINLKDFSGLHYKKLI